jgi:cellulose synthase/poly-beta-1,6-N-acetylglucosamine synthase-like glycosyltransferase
MIEAQAALALGELALAGLAAGPFILHRYRIGKWLKLKPLKPSLIETKLKMTLILPVWNEEEIILSKLENLASQEYPRKDLELLIIDSASTDESMAIAKSWLKENPKAFPNYKIIEMEKRLGKTEAVRQAIIAADEKTEVIVMTDVDATFPPDSLNRLASWFSDPEIGAVGGTPRRSSVEEKAHTEMESTYRDLFTLQRIAESRIDSTPFLEGSIAGFRRSMVDVDLLNVYSNADDSQLATMVRLRGGKSLQDGELCFDEMTPPSNAGRRSRKTRRAQGLCRHLWRNRSAWFSKQHGKFGSIIGNQAMMHLIAPWLVLMAVLLGISRWVIQIQTGSYFEEWYLVLLMIELTIIVAWLGVIFNLKIKGISFLQMFLDSMTNLMIAQFLILRGKSLHVWNKPERG